MRTDSTVATGCNHSSRQSRGERLGSDISVESHANVWGVNESAVPNVRRPDVGEGDNRLAVLVVHAPAHALKT